MWWPKLYYVIQRDKWHSWEGLCVQKTFIYINVLFLTFSRNWTTTPNCTSPAEPIMYNQEGCLYSHCQLVWHTQIFVYKNFLWQPKSLILDMECPTLPTETLCPLCNLLSLDLWKLSNPSFFLSIFTCISLYENLNFTDYILSQSTLTSPTLM